jgi:hypothetical protein
MRSLARANLETDWKRHAAAVTVLALAGILIFFQAGMTLGQWRDLGMAERQLRADLIVQNAQVHQSIGVPLSAIYHAGTVQPHMEGRVWMHPEVAHVAVYLRETVAPHSWGRAGLITRQSYPGRGEFLIIDPAPDSLTFPANFPDTLREVLATPGQVILAQALADQLGAGVGDMVGPPGAELMVGAVIRSRSPAFAMLSRPTAVLMGDNISSPPLGFLVKLRPGADRDRVRAEMETMLVPRGMAVATPEELIAQVSFDMIADRPEIRNLFFSGGFAMLIACAIAVQTMRGAVIAQSAEFGALRALGVAGWRVALIALEQAFLSGLLAVLLALTVGLLLQLGLEETDLSFVMTLELMALVAAGLMAVALFAGVLALSAITRSEPAALLR